MVGRELHRIIKRKPFMLLRMRLTDGRSVLIRHPDLVIVSERDVYIGLARLEEDPPLETPAKDSVVKDWLWISILHVATVEPANGPQENGKARSRRKGKT